VCLTNQAGKGFDMKVMMLLCDVVESFGFRLDGGDARRKTGIVFQGIFRTRPDPGPSACPSSCASSISFSFMEGHCRVLRKAEAVKAIAESDKLEPRSMIGNWGLIRFLRIHSLSSNTAANGRTAESTTTHRPVNQHR
jgi:hypothetical protein